MGNPVRTGSGPAAVTLTLSFARKGPVEFIATVPDYRNGKALDGLGEPEDLPCNFAGDTFLEKTSRP